METIKNITTTINYEIRVEKETDETGDYYIANAYDKIGVQITETDWCWETREEAIKAVKETVASGSKFYSPS